MLRLQPSLLLLLLYVCSCQIKVDESYYKDKRNSLLKLSIKKSNITTTNLGYFAVCVVAKNEHGNLREWVQYHLHKGVSKFYFFDHRSSPPMAEELQEFVDAGHVDYFYFSNSFDANDFEFENGPLGKRKNVLNIVEYQLWAIHSCLKWFGYRHKFISQFDVDEFLILDNQTQTFPEYLKDFEEFGQLVVYRKFFGSSGHQTRPNGTVLESYTKCFPLNRTEAAASNPKPIINMKYFGGWCAVHSCHTTRPSVNSHKIEKTQENEKSGEYERTFDNIWFNHYYSKSFEEFQEKLRRRKSDMDKIYKKAKERLQIVDEASTDVCLEGIELSKQCCSNLSQAN